MLIKLLINGIKFKLKFIVEFLIICVISVLGIFNDFFS